MQLLSNYAAAPAVTPEWFAVSSRLSREATELCLKHGNQDRSKIHVDTICRGGNTLGYGGRAPRPLGVWKYTNTGKFLGTRKIWKH
ncbi:MAG: hypothetical protein OXC26_22455 [Albidovulum sp.]|nr:hypothetical protein [Albidovulum sp.]